MAQNGEWMVGVSGHYGFIMPHRPSMQHLINGHVKGAEISFFRQSDGSRSWETLHGLPQVGIKFYAADLGNPQQLGFCAGLIPYIRLAILKNKSASIGLVLGTSYGYISKRFNTLELRQNNVIGSHWNGIMHGSLDFQRKLFRSITFQSSLSFTHFSNGAVSMPNLGINIPSFSIGFFGRIGGRTSTVPTNPKAEKDENKFQLFSQLAWGLKQVFRYGGKRYHSWALNLMFQKNFGNKFSLGPALNVYYSNATGALIAEYQNRRADNIDKVRVGGGLSILYKINKLSICFQPGVYIFDRYGGDSRFYQRAGIQYALSQRILISNILKVHFGKADHIEFGVGYKIFGK